MKERKWTSSVCFQVTCWSLFLSICLLLFLGSSSTMCAWVCFYVLVCGLASVSPPILSPCLIPAVSLNCLCLCLNQLCLSCDLAVISLFLSLSLSLYLSQLSHSGLFVSASGTLSLGVSVSIALCISLSLSPCASVSVVSALCLFL